MKAAKKVLKKILKFIGFEIRTIHLPPTDSLEINQLLRMMQISNPLIFDIGAHYGEKPQNMPACFLTRPSTHLSQLLSHF